MYCSQVWLFGGRVVNVPCSHVAHLERLGHRNYRVGRLHDTWTNHKRVAEVWLGEYAKYLYYYNPHAQVKINFSLIRLVNACFSNSGKYMKWIRLEYLLTVMYMVLIVLLLFLMIRYEGHVLRRMVDSIAPGKKRRQKTKW